MTDGNTSSVYCLCDSSRFAVERFWMFLIVTFSSCASFASRWQTLNNCYTFFQTKFLTHHRVTISIDYLRSTYTKIFFFFSNIHTIHRIHHVPHTFHCNEIGTDAFFFKVCVIWCTKKWTYCGDYQCLCYTNGNLHSRPNHHNQISYTNHHFYVLNLPNEYLRKIAKIIKINAVIDYIDHFVKCFIHINRWTGETYWRFYGFSGSCIVKISSWLCFEPSQNRCSIISKELLRQSYNTFSTFSTIFGVNSSLCQLLKWVTIFGTTGILWKKIVWSNLVADKKLWKYKNTEKIMAANFLRFSIRLAILVFPSLHRISMDFRAFRMLLFNYFYWNWVWFNWPMDFMHWIPFHSLPLDVF